MVFDKESNIIGFYGTKDLYRIDLPFPDPNFGIYVTLIVFASLVLIGLIWYGIYLLVKKCKKKPTYYKPGMYLRAQDRLSPIL